MTEALNQPDGSVGSPNGILLCDDLLFASRVLAVAREQGLTLRWVREPAAVVEWAQRQPPTGVLLDLHHPQLDLPALLSRLRELCPASPHLIAFGSHVDGQRLQAAEKAGCHQVLPRSRFVALLETQLRHWLTLSTWSSTIS
ncbi:MAG: response regulator [Gemmataceae bacterium]|nr:response regulator [Gemmataceae bacterium]